MEPLSPILRHLQSLKHQPNSPPTLEIENALFQHGFRSVCGIDEAGRGAFAGPLVAASVILGKQGIGGLDDSKRLSKKTREQLYLEITKKAASYSVAVIDVDFINRLGIQVASYKAYRQTVEALKNRPDFVLLDYYEIPDFNVMQFGLKFGDRISQSIAAASIVAKVCRDKIMGQLSHDKRYKLFGFETHKGYGTLLHRKAIKKYGLSDQHRVKYCQTCIDSTN